MNYGPIIVPTGTRTTHKTAVDIDENVNFVDEFNWIDTDYPTIANILKMDVKNYGIDIPKKYLIAVYSDKAADPINIQMLEDRLSNRAKLECPQVGDYLLLPYGLYTRFTHEWTDTIQTGGGSGSSYYMTGSGVCDYSGGLDSGISKKDIEPTDEVKDGNLWFFDRGVSGANRGVYYTAKFKVWKAKEGADLTGCPQIRKHEESLVIAKSEQITLINGNGNQYTIHLPKLVIKCDIINDAAIARIQKNTGLLFTKCFGGYECQPMTCQQITKLFCTYNFSTKRYSNSDYSNHILLTFNN